MWAVATSMIVSAPPTNGSRTSPKAGSSKTHMPSHLYGLMTKIDFFTVILLSVHSTHERSKPLLARNPWQMPRPLDKLPGSGRRRAGRPESERQGDQQKTIRGERRLGKNSIDVACVKFA